MTWKFVVTAALVSTSAISTIAFIQGQAMRSEHVDAPKRQLVDAKLLHLEHETHLHGLQSLPGVQPARTPLVSSAAVDPANRQHLPSKFNLDLAKMTMKFGTNELDDLIQQGSTVLPLPDSTPIELRLVSVVQRHGVDHIKAEYQGLVSTITRRGDTFYATVASPFDSYRIQGGSTEAQVFPHRLLAQRTIRSHTDYRYVH